MKSKHFNSYESIPKKYQFDIESILEGKTIDDLFFEYAKLFKERIKQKNSKYENIENYIKDLKISNQMELIFNKIENYLSNKNNVNLIDNFIINKQQEFQNLNNSLEIEFGSENNRFFKNIEKLKVWKEDPRLKTYKIHIEQAINEYDHKLEDNIEEFLIKKQKSNANFQSIFEILVDSEIKRNDALDSQNKPHKLNEATRFRLLKSNDKILRKNTIIEWTRPYFDHKNTLSQLLFQHFQNLVIEAKVRNYSSTVEMLTQVDKVDNKLLSILFEKVSEKSKIFKRFWSKYKEFYKKKFNEDFVIKTDLHRELVFTNFSYSLEETQKIVYEALTPFGKEYSSKIKEAFEDRWIDYMCANNKQSGAYSIGSTYGINKKFILMNFDGELNSLETLAHELGHSMHSYFSDKNQPIENSQYSIFLAEIASIFNELMLYDFLLKTSKNDKFKFKILTSMILGFLGTTVKQIEWANFEFDLYDKIEKEQISSSYEDLAKLYFANSKKYSIKKKEKLNLFDISYFLCVPHFYYDFYVYKYGIGQLCANFFFMQYKKQGDNFLQKYIEHFLSKGCSELPLDILKNMGIELQDNEFYDKGFDFVDDLIKQWIQLGNKLF